MNPLREPATVWLSVALHLVGANEAATVGTFVASGLVSDSGALPARSRFPSLSPDLRLALVVNGAEALAGTEGAIAVAYDGVFEPAAGGILVGRGAWRVTGGDNAYEHLSAGGTWTGTARFAPELVLDAVLEGRGRLL